MLGYKNESNCVGFGFQVRNKDGTGVAGRVSRVSGTPRGVGDLAIIQRVLRLILTLLRGGRLFGRVHVKIRSEPPEVNSARGGAPTPPTLTNDGQPNEEPLTRRRIMGYTADR